jgi:hypothetical protein
MQRNQGMGRNSLIRFEMREEVQGVGVLEKVMWIAMAGGN